MCRTASLFLLQRLIGSMSGDARFQQHGDTSCHKVFFFFPARQGAEGNYAILTETLACFLPLRAKDLSTPLFK